MRCPECNKPDAYVGLLWVHCKNTNCKYFDPELVGERTKLTPSERLILLRGLVAKKPDDADDDDDLGLFGGPWSP